MSDTMDIYAIQHNVTGRIYVGITENVDRRVKAHMADLRKHRHINYALQEDYDKYGYDYSVYILEFNVLRQDRWKEKYYIEILNTDDDRIGYNGRDPRYSKAKGDAGWRFADGTPKVKGKEND